MIDRPLYMQQVRPFMGKNVIKVITGVRRSGKSTLLKLIQDELIADGASSGSIVSLNFESPLNDRLVNPTSLYDHLASLVPEDGMTHFFLDEIQEVKGWERVINGLQADFHDRVDIYVTGSNAHLLSSEFATVLAGRYIEIRVYPFGFKEYLDLRRLSRPDDDVRESFSAYLKTGGMPALAEVGFETEASARYLSGIFDTIVLKDIIRRYEVRDPDLLDTLLKYVIANSGHVFSANSISKTLAGRNITVAPSTITSYLRYAVDSNFLVKALREDAITKKVFTSKEKYYLVDHGFRQALYGHNFENIDLVLENIVFMELVRHGWSLRVGDVSGKEVDFIAERDGKRLYIQVCYLLASDEVRKREFGVFKKIGDNYPKYVLSLDEVPMSRDGIIHMNIRDFLLSDVSE